MDESQAYIPLRLFSPYSLLEGAIQPEELAKLCVQHRIPAAALTDRNTLSGCMKYANALIAAGVQPIIGLTIGIARPQKRDHTSLKNNKANVDWLTLLAQDDLGYRNLSQLATLSWDCLLEDRSATPHLIIDQIQEKSDGIIALTGGYEGVITALLADGQDESAQELLMKLQKLFPSRLYIELMRNGDPLQRLLEPKLIDLAYRFNIPLVATNPVFFKNPDFHEAHNILLCIRDGCYLDELERPLSRADDWFKSPKEMAEVFADLPEAIVNTRVIAQRCATCPPVRNPILPSFGDPNEDEAQMLSDLARKGLANRLEKVKDPDTQRYRERLEYELETIIDVGFAGYFLIVMDFVRFAKEQGIPIGPGRGSGAGSLVSWSLQITNIDPLQYGLLFERFLNRERGSMPDFDIDFSETRRDEVINYVRKRFGQECVSQIVTFGGLKARAVVKDVARVMQISYGEADRLAKMIPNDPNDVKTLSQSLEEVPELRAQADEKPKVKKLFEIASRLEGLYRHTSTHAAGVVIGDRPIAQLIPLMRDAQSGMRITQFDMKMCEKAGLVKFDFLSLKTLAILERTVTLLAKKGIAVELDSLPQDDPEVFKLLAAGNTTGIFQLESVGMRSALAQVRPNSIEEIVALVALYRPGPMDSIPSYAARKHGHEAVTSLHPLLDDLLHDSYGIIVYQEQVIEIAKILAGYSLARADDLRHAMGKKDRAGMDLQKRQFVEGAHKQGVSEQQASTIFELIRKFAGYGFNKSHAAAYAIVAYQMAWFKTHHPLEFYASAMSFDKTQTDKIAIWVDDLRTNGFSILPPNINASATDFTVEATKEGHALRYALGALKGVGAGAMDALITERQEGGPFEDLADFLIRLPAGQINRKQLESLILGGALDCLNDNRTAMHSAIEYLVAFATRAAEEKDSKQTSLFSESGEDDPATKIALPDVDSWSTLQKIQYERDAFGYYFSSHPLDEYDWLMENFSIQTAQDIQNKTAPRAGYRTSVKMAGQVEDLRRRTSKKGNRWIMADLSDRSGRYEVRCFDIAPQEHLGQAFAESKAVLLDVELQWKVLGQAPLITVREVRMLSQMKNETAFNVEVDFRDNASLEPLAHYLDRLQKGNATVNLRLHLDGGIAEIALANRYIISQKLTDELRHIDGVLNAKLIA